MSKKVTIQVNKSTIESNNAQLLMCEVKDYLEENGNTTGKNKNQKRKEYNTKQQSNS